MGTLDWGVLLASLAFIVGYGTWRNRHPKTLDHYLVSGRQTRWWTVAVSIMATQASAITFLSTPGQAFTDGMRFAQFYFGLPLAMVVLSVVAVPVYHRLRVYTAYEYLENRFDAKTRGAATFLFLLQRGLSTGVSIYATSIVLSVLLGWNVQVTNVVIGGLVVVYTATGGSTAVAWTQSWQFLVAMAGMAVAFAVTVTRLPESVSFGDALATAGALGRLNLVDGSFDLTNRYNLWSGIVGGFFLALSYFGADQSQVGRYLGGRSVAESRTGLLVNGLVKVPMQLFILFVGVMVLVFHQFVAPPLFFNPVEAKRLAGGPHAARWAEMQKEKDAVFEAKRAAIGALLEARRSGDSPALSAARARVVDEESRLQALRKETVALLKASGGKADTNDANYVFLSFVLHHLPAGLVGLLIAVVFAAAMSSNAAALNALASCTVVDVYLRVSRKEHPDAHAVRVSKLATVFWGLFSVAFAMFSNRLGTLVEAVNILGSLVYGTMLGIFLLAFFFKRVGGTACFWGAIAGEAAVVWCFAATKLSFLWYNVVGALVVVAVALALEPFVGRRRPEPAASAA